MKYLRESRRFGHPNKAIRANHPTLTFELKGIQGKNVIT
jgi:hypothetical protein